MSATDDFTVAVQDYLKAIYALESSGERVTTSALATRMKVSAPSATAMAKRLADLGLVERAPYRGVALTAESAKSGITIRPFDPLREELPGPITATREFQAGDRLSVYAEVYESLQNAAEHVIDMKIELRTDARRGSATTREERSSKELAGAGGHGFLAQVPLEDAAPGLYVIHVEASANAGDRPTASRDILIRVL